ncbi:MAG TPA: LytTR family DNA-binding domain-containing protein [Prolixibacteraceae bacterium]
MEKDQLGILIIESDKVEQQKIVEILQSNPLELSIEVAEDTDFALLKIIDTNPDMVFLEYPVKGKTGTGIIKFIQSKFPQSTIVFISASKDYAAEAIHFEVYDYLLRPVRKTEVKRLLEKVHLRKRSNSLSRINELIEKKGQDTILRFNTIKGFIITTPDEILYCKADGSFTELHFTNKTMELTFLYLSQIDEILNPFNFIRISRSIIVNKNYIRKVNLKTNTLILTSNGEECEIIGSRVTLREFGKYI